MNSLEDRVAQEYDKRFTEKDLEIFEACGVDVVTANSYNRRFDGNNIAKMVKEGVSPSFSEDFEDRYDGWMISVFHKRSISAQEANKVKCKKHLIPLLLTFLIETGGLRYADECIERFDFEDIRELAKSKVPMEEALKYNARRVGEKQSAFDIDKMCNGDYPYRKVHNGSWRFSGKQIAELFSQGISPDTADRYDDRFDGEDIAYLHAHACSYRKANAFNSGFSAKQVLRLVDSRCRPGTANRYDKRLIDSGTCADLYERKLWPSMANRYLGASKNCGPKHIIRLLNIKVRISEVKDFLARFGWDALEEFVKIGLVYNDIRHYDARFTGGDICNLRRRGIGPKIANQYKRYDGLEVCTLIKGNISASVANQYVKLSPEEVIAIETVRLGKDETSQYHNLDRLWGGERLVISDDRFMVKDRPDKDKQKVECTSTTLIRTSQKFVHSKDVKAASIKFMYHLNAKRLGLSFSELGNEYDDYRVMVEAGLTSYDIETMRNTTVGEVMESTRSWIESEGVLKFIGYSPLEAAVLHVLHITPETVGSYNAMGLDRLLKAMVGEMKRDLSDYELVGVGRSGFVVRQKSGDAYKFSLNAKREIECILKVMNALKEKPKNVVKLYHIGYENTMKEISYFGIDFVDGDTLDRVIDRDGSLPPERVLRYGSQILNGIWELRQGDVYHRDLHPQNILVENSKDNAMIVDLGEATIGDYVTPSGNRGYGGNNDIISLGQIMYKMATGHNLFNDGYGLTYENPVKDRIKSDREVAYSDRQKLIPYLDRVKEGVKDERLAGIIIKLLDDDLGRQPDKARVEQMKRLFD